MIRLDKYLSEMGIGTRQQVKKSIRQGKVSVDDGIINKPDYKVDETVQTIYFDGREVAFVSFEYYMLNKPAGVVSAATDKHMETVVDLIKDKTRKDLFPVGRLDKDTEGLLLITNDGALAHRLLSPMKHVNKTYYAKIAGVVTEKDIASFEQGVNIGTKDEEEWTRPGHLTIVNSGPISEIRLSIHEGKYHQVKRMFQAVGKEVLYLKRESMGNLKLDKNLSPGEYRSLTKEELERL